ncbi:hypothetical protein SNE35_25345 [Paucibacter sp. R3-3]|uniref:DUF2268 domain-containing protein n=1 Tax=Roseateles agri TaxID=3098619 RepID=A0ABU5DNJ1_9BURK|nr:hypothetical protein [Paucibacter sp. R3-3]MDY0747853.1 hypothetical protein [Paucibacter sp. R3-3]
MKSHIARRRALQMLGASLLPVSTMAAPLDEASSLRDLMPAFWRAYDEGQGQPSGERARLLRQNFFAPHAADYARAGAGVAAAARDEARIGRWLASFDPIAADARAISLAFGRLYAAQLASFRRALPDFDNAASPVALLPSLFYFDAHLEPAGSMLPLFFSPDGIVRYHGASADLSVLFAHELFHCYQGQKNAAMSIDPQPPLFASLWIEGTATLASERLNPDASLLHVLLDDPRLVAPDGDVLRRAAAAALKGLDSTDEALAESLLSAGYGGADWPPRAGYLIGLLVGRRAAEQMSLPQIAALPAPQVREAMAKGLRELLAT